MNNFNKLVNYFIEASELGSGMHYDNNNFSIMLYDIPNSKEKINQIKEQINEITKNYKLVVLNPNQLFSNINILDIDL